MLLEAVPVNGESHLALGREVCCSLPVDHARTRRFLASSSSSPSFGPAPSIEFTHLVEHPGTNFPAVSIFGLLFLYQALHWRGGSVIRGVDREAIVAMPFAKSDCSHPKPAIWCIKCGLQITAPLRAACSVRDTSFQTLIRPHPTFLFQVLS